MDKKYESTYQRRDYTEDPSYRPLQVADRTGETQRVINSRERQETLNRQSTDIYQKSYLDRLKREGENQVAQAKELTQLGELSQSLAGELTKMERSRGEAAALDQEMIDYERGIPANQMMSFDNQEAELAAEGAAIDTASANWVKRLKMLALSVLVVSFLVGERILLWCSSSPTW